MKSFNKKKALVQGPIDPIFIADSISKHSLKTDIGAHSIFLGQVRKDSKDGKLVTAIEFSVYELMAEEELHLLRERTFQKFNLSCMHIYHSTGIIKTGQINMFVFTSSKHRNDAMAACAFVVEEIKKKVPVFGKEIYEDDSFGWKVNT